MNILNTNFVQKGLKAIFVMLFFCCLTMQAQDRYFTLKGKGINVRKAPVSGSVIGKVSPPYSFYAEEKDGWVGLWYNRQRGYISGQFVEEVELANFSRKHLGDYMGIPSPLYGDGYCLVTLKEKDGYVLMHIGDYSAPQDGGLRNSMFWTYAGVPEKNGVRFTHELYPYREDVPVWEQMTDETKREDYVLVVGKDGILYTTDRILEPQETAKDAEDLPLTERSLFMLRGDVKSVQYLRSYPEAFFQRHDEYVPFSNFAHIYNFSEEGDLTDVSLYDGEINKVAEYTFARHGDRVKVSGTEHTLHINAEYVRDISNFEISYNGDWTRDDGSASMIGNTYAFDMKGRMFGGYFCNWAPPFVTHGDGDEDYERYQYGAGPALPDNIFFEFPYGGDVWFLQAGIKDMEIDAQGNWTERKAFDEDGKLMFIEKRKISYYGAPQADNAGAADDNIYATVEQNPEYPGGTVAMMTFIASNLRYPGLCQENGIKGRVVLKFVVEPDGSIGEIKTVSSPHYLLEKEAIRILRKMPKWKPGRQSGRPVRTWYTIPVNFALN